MPELIPNIYEQTGEAFDRKLATLTNFAQQVKRNSLIKQQQAEQFAQKKDLIEFRADVQLDKQKQFYEDVTKPQKEAAQKQEMLENLQASFEEAKKKMEGYTDDLYSKQYSGVHDYNLLDARFAPERNEDGSYDASIYVNLGKSAGEDSYQKVDYQTYRDLLQQTTNFANFLDRVKEAEQEGTLAEAPSLVRSEKRGGQTVQVQQIGAQNAKQYIQNIRNNPDFRYRQIGNYQNELLEIAQQTEEPKEGKPNTPKSFLYPAVGQFMAKVDQKPIQNYGTVEDSFWPWGGSDQRKAQIDYSADVQSVRTQIQSTLNDVYNIDISQVQNPEAINAMAQGNETNLEGDLVGYARKAQEDSKIGELLTAYNFYSSAYQEWASQSANATRPDRVKLNFKWTGGDIGGAFDVIDTNDPAQKAEMNMRALHNRFMQ